jgi:Pyruvate/2-oxoacid:ferredoxin oxidoreductase delta subunit
MDAKYLELAARIGLGQSERIAKLFQIIASPAEAELLLALPGGAKAMADKLGRPEEEVATMIRTLFVKGVVFESTRTDPPTYRMCRDLVQFHDASILWPEAPQEYLDLWNEFMEHEWYDIAKMVSQAASRPFTRVIPVGVTVPAKTHVLAFEDVKEIIETSRNLAVTKCTCRLVAHKCDKTMEACIQVNKAADYTLKRGSGRQITKQEAFDIMRQAEEDGLIHVVVNKQNVDHFICNCCPCCCQTMPVLIKHGISVIEPSRFAANVDSDACSACGTCLDRCYFGAISQEGEEPATVNQEKCLGCGLCQVTCPSDAISMKEVRGTDFVPEKMFG